MRSSERTSKETGESSLRPRRLTEVTMARTIIRAKIQVLQKTVDKLQKLSQPQILWSHKEVINIVLSNEITQNSKTFTCNASNYLQL